MLYYSLYSTQQGCLTWKTVVFIQHLRFTTVPQLVVHELYNL